MDWPNKEMMPTAADRFLQNGTSADDSEFLPGKNDSEILLRTIVIYGSIFVVSFLTFCVVRKHYQKTFNVRSWAPGHESQLAQGIAAEANGYFNWIRWILRVSDDEIREQCGMDALCLIRQFKFGMKISLVGLLNSLWLIPVFATETDGREDVTDPVAKASLTYIPSGSLRVIGTVVATYINFGMTMQFILREFEWFARHRHAYLQEKTPRNHTVYVTGLPPQLQSDEALCDYFERIYSSGNVVSGHVYLNVPKLEKKISKRFQVMRKLEHLINMRKLKKSKKVETLIEETKKELDTLNQEIPQDIAKIEQLYKESADSTCDCETGKRKLEVTESSTSSRLGEDSEKSISVVKALKPIVQTARMVSDTAQTSVTVAKKFVKVGEEGSPREAGFVVFSSLAAKNAALQTLLAAKPFAVDANEGHDQENLFHKNVGKSQHQLGIGRLVTLGIVFALRLAWTFPVAFIASLHKLDAVQGEVPRIEKLVENNPWMVEFFAVLAPLLLIVLNSCLPTLLEWITLLEYPISQAQQIARQFPKLAAFMLIQTFFVSAISGSLWAEISAIVSRSDELFQLLGRALAGQATFFMQVLLVKTFIGISMELLKFLPLFKSNLRRFVGPRLSAEERSRRYLGFIRPMGDPLWLLHAEIYSANVLYFMVFFVYASTAPLVNWCLMFCFLLLYPARLYQVLTNYPVKPDTGGQMWITFMHFVRASAVIGQLSEWALLALKRFPYAIAVMVPLLVINVLFNVFVEHRHSRLSQFLPSEKCVEVDEEREDDDMAFLQNVYEQPFWKEGKPLYPPNFDDLNDFEDEKKKKPIDVEADDTRNAAVLRVELRK